MSLAHVHSYGASRTLLTPQTWRIHFSNSLWLHIPGVYLSLNDDIIPNNGYVMISDIGSTEDTALICHTNRPATVSGGVDFFHSGGDWVGPSGVAVGGLTMGTDNVPGFMRNRDPMIVRLLRNTATDPPLEGIFHCEVEDNTFTQQTVYVGVYNSGEGTMYVYT